MASQQAFQQYGHTNKGTLQPGQTISVNKYNVQVERYLSQGGFAHVYLVRTATPVYNTTHHVLKRIAVANDAMLTEVKKEVDIMRILKGHPNIVHLIDAAWHRMPTGMYEVFILMEFCSGGGIIDMMNRRLRERLTEAEILQIFVDVCEGVAAMHNLRPALLHRDLKVENILQSTPTSFKLCDFGSATPVMPKPPSTMQEIRALEADLNRHTTLQYRAPEMVDPYLRRPVDEKSDVWALGVLLYKLCYYTTPFEEHGPLAILNVQYRTPPYPVYSIQMNGLIASMLREHGAQRPSTFEILTHVHRLRGTTSRFSYSIPSPQPLSPRQPATNPLDNLVSFRSSSGNSSSNSPSRNAGVQAREKVLEAIAPMRRGRPTSSTPYTPESKSRTSSPQKDGVQGTQGKVQNWLDVGFAEQEDKAWKVVKSSQGGPPIRGHRSGVASMDAWKLRNPVQPMMDEAWSVEGRGKEPTTDKPKPAAGGGFDNDFAEKLWSSFEVSSKDASSKPEPIPSRLPVIGNDSRGKLAVPRKSQDAFEGLGLSPADRPPPQTLGEARKLRTGLAVVNGNAKSGVSLSPSLQTSRPSSSLAPRATPSPRPSQYSGSTPAPATNPSSWKSSPVIPASKPHYLAQAQDVSAESRYPSVEELDATFSSPSLGSAVPPVHSTSQPQLVSPTPVDMSSPAIRPKVHSNVSGGLHPGGQSSYSKDGVRSAQVTGVAMRESKATRAEGVQKHNQDELVDTGVTSHLRRNSRPIRPSLSRKHRSSIVIKQAHHSGNDVLSSPVQTSPVATPNPRLPQPRDWLTGDDSAAASPVKPQSTPTETPMLLQFTNKRSSIILFSSTEIQSPQEAVTAEQLPPLLPSSPTKPKHGTPRTSRPVPSVDMADIQKDVPGKLVRSRSPARANVTRQNDKTTSSSDEGPEDVNGSTPSKTPKRKGSKKRKGRQSSVHDLVDLWGGGVVHLKEKEKDKEDVQSPTAGESKSPGSEVYVKPLARRSTFLPPSPSNPRSASPQSASSSPTKPSRSSRPHRTSHHQKQPANVGKPSAAHAQTPPSGRTRPSSMYVFPVANSKSDSCAALPSSPGLSSPEVPASRRTRRTSISDMVQRYEAIGGSPKGPGPAPPPTTTQKPTAMKVATQTTSSGTTVRPLRMSQGNSTIITRGNTRAGSALPVPDDGPAGTSFHSRTRTSPTSIARTRTSSAGYRDSIWTREVENPNLVPPRRSSPEKLAVVLDELSVSGRQSSQFSFPTRPPPTPPPAVEEPKRSPSPERPYQGVGKLIDQWQRKTAETEADPNPSPRRSGFAAKRALPGFVGGGAGRER